MLLQRAAAILSFSIVALVSSAIARPLTGLVCNPNAPLKGLQDAQQAAIEDYGHIILDLKDPQAAFDKYIPGGYFQHSAGIPRSGRQPTLDFLIPLFTAPGVSVYHLRVFASKGYGFLHYQLDLRGGREAGGTSLAVIDIFKFQGTCIVEHWDALQQITGTEVNPNAYF
ncbi:hypothetical protein DFP72DRAFT_885074 [Ephemerocybe angulata]|uniref:SnoaL-like domain-containing protein n=1 Tax=Ephemerocybe angulata TaxID=980116 RepID=A0A8H6MBU2_9AGAR|nr:hypothetical protein DFP72DRAFT_885074 [Tulosesus angulatus]